MIPDLHRKCTRRKTRNGMDFGFLGFFIFFNIFCLFSYLSIYFLCVNYLQETMMVSCYLLKRKLDQTKEEIC